MTRRLNAYRSSPLSPAVLLLVLWIVHSARWIWIAGFGDYGWTYESAARIANHQVQYRDFISTLPPLTSYAMAPLYLALHGSLWSWHLQLYLWWGFALFVGLAVASELGMSHVNQMVVVVVATCISYPAATLGHSYNYAATAFAGLSLVLLLRWNTSGSARTLFLAGGSAGLCFLAKQNVGGICILTAFVTVFLLQPLYRRRIAIWKSLRLLGSGVLTSLAPPALYFIVYAGPKEFLLQFLVDAGKGKGGILTVLGRPIPRIILAGGPTRRLEVVLSVVLLCVWIYFALRIVRRTIRQISPANNVQNSTPVWPRGVLVAVGLVVSFSLLSLSNMPAVNEALTSLRLSVVENYFHSMLTVLYSLTVYYAAAAALLTRGKWRSMGGVVILWAISISYAHATSLLMYFAFAAPLAVVLVLSIAEILGHSSLVRSLVLSAGIVGFLVSILFPPYACTFCRLEQMPQLGAFAGLYAPTAYVRFVEDMDMHVSSVISGKP